MQCLKCGADSGRSNFCRLCRGIKRNAEAIVCQNKTKMKRLLNESDFTPKWLEKFIIYSGKIKDYGIIVMEYKEVETKRTFENIMKIGIVVNCFLCILFILEILIIKL